ncbi:hypothetical protein JCM6882_005123 [Rhodosporidiobolus microsporus]
MRFRSSLVSALACAFTLFSAPALAAFGVSTSGSTLTVDSGSNLVFTINTSNGDIRSMKYKGKELQDQSKFSHLVSGLGKATVSSKVSGDVIIVTSTSTNIGGDLTQYFIVKKGVDTIYMATRAASEPDVGELRFIFRLNKANLPNGYAFIDDRVHGVTGSGVGAWIVISETGYEKSSGGAFFRDIDQQGSSQQELYFPYRIGLFGPYALVVNDGSTPSSDLDFSFFDNLGLRSYYSKSARGYVSGKVSDVAAGFADYVTVGWKSVHQQYWARASSSGSFTSPPMIPGTYTQTLYKMELEVATKSSVVVTAGKTTTADIASGEADRNALWTIGSVDGTPRGFLNADKIETMHPSDSRMSAWGPVVFRVGSSSEGSWPMAQFMNVNQGNQVVFSLTAEQAARGGTFEVGVTSSFAGGRPQVTVNSYTGKAPAAPTKINSRGITRGTWRGYNIAYATTIPASALVAGENTATIQVISGSSGDAFLSPNIVFDYIRFY